MNLFRFCYDRVVAAAARPDVALVVVYAAGLVAGLVTEMGSTGKPLLAIAAPVTAGVLIRLARSLTTADALRLAALHLVFALILGRPAAVFAVDIARDLVSIACAVHVFAMLRQRGFITSQVRLAGAVAIVALVAASAASAMGALQTPADASWARLAVFWASSATAFTLVLWVVLTHDRQETPLSAGFGAIGERPASTLEHVAAALLVAVLIAGAVWHGRSEAAFAASTALLWFALRLGLFPTAIAAFSFALALLGFAADGRWPSIFGGADAIEADLVRYVAIALFAAPSILVAATVHDHKRAKQAFAYRARHDGLTELANRSHFLELLEALSASSRGGRRFALLLIDLDYFKTVNDSFGHARGDALLVEVARRLRTSIRATDLAARVGGDEFAVLAPVRTVEDAQSVAKRLVETVNQSFDLGGVRYAPSITIGGVIAPDSATEAARLMLLADEALYLAKAAGRNCWRFKTTETEDGGAPAWAMGEGSARTETVFID